MSKLAKYWRYLENVVFLVVAVIIMYGLVEGFSKSTWTSLSGNGFEADLVDPIRASASR